MRQLIAGNWKMNGLTAEAAAIAEDFSDLVRLAEALLPPGGP